MDLNRNNYVRIPDDEDHFKPFWAIQNQGTLSFY